MPELEVLEAKVPVRTPRAGEARPRRVDRASPRSPRWFSGPVFSRARDIFAANMTELLDRSEDPSRMIRMIILEMEETLVEVRATAARSIADIKEMRRAVEPARRASDRLDRQGRAGAVARTATTSPRRRSVERQKAGRHGRRPARRARPDRAGAARLRGRHRQAPGQAARSPRPPERDRGPVRERGHPRQGPRDHARQPDRRTRSRKFELLERRADFAEGRCEALGITSLEDEIRRAPGVAKRSTPSSKR